MLSFRRDCVGRAAGGVGWVLQVYHLYDDGELRPHSNYCSALSMLNCIHSNICARRALTYHKCFPTCLGSLSTRWQSVVELASKVTCLMKGSRCSQRRVCFYSTILSCSHGTLFRRLRAHIICARVLNSDWNLMSVWLQIQAVLWMPRLLQS